MNVRCLTVLLLAYGFAVASAQAPKPHFGKAVVSPEVLSDGRITFRLKAPNAKKVIVDREGFSPLSMDVDARGVWSATTEALSPDYYVYSFIVDGMSQGDPSNPLIKPIVTGGFESVAHVPGPKELVWESNDVPHGTLHCETFESKIIGEQREFWVYTPPGYDASSRKSYPTLYLLHGVMEGASSWTVSGRVNVIMDNLIARKLAKPMVLVMPLGYGFPDVPNRLGEIFAGIGNQVKFDAFNASLTKEILPLMEQRYRVSKNRDARALAGLSMGGAQALYEGLAHPDDFATVASFSGAFIMYGNPAAWFPKIPAKTPVLTITCGTEDFLIVSQRKTKEWLKSKGVVFKDVETPGAHTWMVWRRNLADFAPSLFR